MDQSLFAAPHGFSQRITSFIACACQGIHQMPLRHLIVLIANAHPYLGLEFLVLFACAQRASKSDHPHNLAIAFRPVQKPGYLLQPGSFMMPSTCSTRLLYWNYAEQFACNLIFKTSFSRLDPIPRGQATVIRSSIRHCQRQRTINDPERQASHLPPAPPPYPAG
jgi:hypothetical protein